MGGVMGCDIHVAIEARHNGKWYPVARPDTPRDYDAFARLVRDHGRGDAGDFRAVPARGIPSDSPFAGAEDLGVLGDHTFSWLTPAEFRAAVPEEPEQMPWADMNGWKYLHSDLWDWCGRTEIGEANVRIVFGFDS